VSRANAFAVDRLHVVGLSHRTAPLEVRARAALGGRRSRLALHRALASAASEAVVLATCNRTELYVSGGFGACAAATRALLEATELTTAEFADHCYCLTGREAFAHLLRVAASLESMNVGEPEIQGQLRAAVADARAVATLGPTLAAAFRHAGTIGKRVRRLTDIGRGAVSLPSLVVGTARDELGDLSEVRATLVGAGHLADMAARALAAQRLAELRVVNRSGEAAVRLARLVGAEATPFPALEPTLARSDLVICCTSSRDPVITSPLLERAGAERKRRLVLVDLAVPPDVAPGCQHLPGVRVHRLESLVTRATQNRERRSLEARRAEQIVEEFVDRVLAHSGSELRLIAA